MRPAHTIELVPWRGTSTGERIAMEMTSMALWPLQDDARMTVLINLMAAPTVFRILFSPAPLEVEELHRLIEIAFSQ